MHAIRTKSLWQQYSQIIQKWIQLKRSPFRFRLEGRQTTEVKYVINWKLLTLHNFPATSAIPVKFKPKIEYAQS